MSPNQKAINIARLYVETLRKKNLPIKSVILFGSQARGDYEPDSDIDVLVVTERLDTEIREAILDEAFEISLSEDVMLIPLIYDLEKFESPLFRSGPLYQSITQEGIIIQ
ncbi:Nucleotidyltransferase domain-containing protein [Thermanaeromonas toyohensis ToBE]|uniref:Nucleotidyltransferase domain-containing protein n=1 Tax=Thermanaeromonas toyohensis ToBE TaxID=698762 RepID=A0A1W1VR81_9FIRM|nr:nucleotidyltransferase domain-containing protein [Thermanaeromonas toyohensis]SMB95859.1 Nucleotidyltransferase domain-containing protein [Thermanaeromonas toyohensis ToBE]